jgi:hypothetical protein
MLRHAVAALEVVIAAAHAHAGFDIWRDRAVVEHVLPTDKFAVGFPGATATGIYGVLFAYAGLFGAVAALRRALPRAGRVAEVLVLAAPTLAFVSFVLPILAPRTGPGPELLQSTIVAVYWAPGVLALVWLLLHPVLALLLILRRR